MQITLVQSILETDRPEVLIPAPIYMGLFMGLGYGLNLALPFSLHAGYLQTWSGWLLIVLATILLLWCFSLFLSSKTTIMPRNPVSTLVQRGPYRFSRNPMYVSLGLFHLGIALSTGNAWHLLTFLPDMLIIRYAVIAPEEAYMQQKFGEAYTRYCQQVPRWIKTL